MVGVRIPPAARCVCARVAKPAVVVPPMHGKARGEIISFGVRYHLSVPSLRYIPALQCVHCRFILLCAGIAPTESWAEEVCELKPEPGSGKLAAVRQCEAGSHVVCPTVPLLGGSVAEARKHFSRPYRSSAHRHSTLWPRRSMSILRRARSTSKAAASPRQMRSAQGLEDTLQFSTGTSSYHHLAYIYCINRSLAASETVTDSASQPV